MRHSHVAGLGSIGISPSSVERIAFWTKLHQRLAALANRIDAKAHGAILAAVRARIPMPTPDDQRVVLIENARADARQWEALADMQANDIEGHKALVLVAVRFRVNSTRNMFRLPTDIVRSHRHAAATNIR